jgi:hypothetical protein
MGFQHTKQISKRKVEGLARKERISMSLLVVFPQRCNFG